MTGMQNSIRRHLGTTLVLALCLTVASCTENRSTSVVNPTPEASPETLGTGGIVVSARIRDDSGSNLTHNESRLRVDAVLGEGKVVNPKVWIEVRAMSNRGSATPIRAGQGGEDLTLPPGEYHVTLSYKVSAYANAKGTIGRVSLRPATSTLLEAVLSFEPAVVTLNFNNGKASVNTEVALTLKNQASPIGGSLQPRPGAEITLLPGTYSVRAIWKPGQGLTRTYVGQIQAKPGRSPSFEHDFNVPLSRVTLQVEDDHATGGRHCQSKFVDGSGVTIAQGMADSSFVLPRGVYELHVACALGPFVKHETVLKNVKLTHAEQPIPLTTTVPAGTVRFQVYVGTDDVTQRCHFTFQNEGQRGQGAKASSAPPWLVPAGVWNVTVECSDGATRRIQGLTVRPRQELNRILRL